MSLLTVPEAARHLGLTENTVRRYAREGYLPAVKLGPRRWRINADAPLPARPVATPPKRQRGAYAQKGR